MSRKPPQAALEVIPKPEISEMISSLRQLHDLGECRTDQELRQRVDWYFDFCERSAIRPGIETMCMALHISRMTLLRWARGENCSPERQEIAASAKQFCIAYVEAATFSGRLNPASSCFVLKNWAGYKDQITIEESAQPLRLAPTMTPEEIAARIAADIPVDEEYTADVIDGN